MKVARFTGMILGILFNKFIIWENFLELDGSTGMHVLRFTTALVCMFLFGYIFQTVYAKVKGQENSN